MPLNEIGPQFLGRNIYLATDSGKESLVNWSASLPPHDCKARNPYPVAKLALRQDWRLAFAEGFDRVNLGHAPFVTLIVTLRQAKSDAYRHRPFWAVR